MSISVEVCDQCCTTKINAGSIGCDVNDLHVRVGGTNRLADDTNITISKEVEAGHRSDGKLGKAMTDDKCEVMHFPKAN